jgi:uncharacterized protein YidB (DUF937 family)
VWEDAAATTTDATEGAGMSGLDDLLGSLTKGQGAGQGGGGLEDLLGGLLGGGSSGGGGGGLQDVLGGLLGGGASGGSPSVSAGGMNLGALAAALAPMLGSLLKGGGLSQLVQNAQASGLGAQAGSWVGTGQNQPVSGQEIRGVVGDDAVRNVAQQAGISQDEAADVLAQLVPQVVNGLTPGGQVPSEDELGRLAAKFGG